MMGWLRKRDTETVQVSAETEASDREYREERRADKEKSAQEWEAQFAELGGSSSPKKRRGRRR